MEQGVRISSYFNFFDNNCMNSKDDLTVHHLNVQDRKCCSSVSLLSDGIVSCGELTSSGWAW